MTSLWKMDRPFVIISSAMSADGKLASEERAQIRLSNETDRKAVDKIRSEVDAVLVGSTTLGNDDPSLTLKYDEHRQSRKQRGLPEQPMKVAISVLCDIGLESKFLRDGDAEKIVFTTSGAPEEKVKAVRKYATVIPSETSRVDIHALLQVLQERGVKRLLVEGGGSTNASFIRAGVVDEIRIAIAPTIIGGSNSPTFIDGPDNCNPMNLELMKSQNLDGMMILHYKVLANLP